MTLLNVHQREIAKLCPEEAPAITKLLAKLLTRQPIRVNPILSHFESHDPRLAFACESLPSEARNLLDFLQV